MVLSRKIEDESLFSQRLLVNHIFECLPSASLRELRRDGPNLIAILSQSASLPHQ
jgi:hypothetical protein